MAAADKFFGSGCTPGDAGYAGLGEGAFGCVGLFFFKTMEVGEFAGLYVGDFVSCS